eukprot:TRINITY_DN15116_c0_g2_i1.p1 TRINITY_DN15116_c0_g2~~TRINITY_DN15116_c0_g2_i1.p1  ORF type:complete len:196 (+),score=15.37 TRINITY_DN15116_c0_g2_i1:110-697(+)
MPLLKLHSVRRRDFDGLSDDDTPWVVLRQHDDNGNIVVTRDQSGARGSPNRSRTASASRPSVLAGSMAWPTQQATSQAIASPLPSATSAKVLVRQSINEGDFVPCGRRSGNGEMPQPVTTGAVLQHVSTIEEKKKLMHDQGRCRPCAFHTTRSEGCRNGLECAFCHLCDKTMHNFVKRKLRKGQASERVPFRLHD